MCYQLDEETAKLQVKTIINGLNFGKDGYYFVYDPQGVNLVHPIQSHLVGKNLYSIRDKQGDQVIKELLIIANSGGGYYQYFWNRPSTHIDEKKIAYVVTISRWGWMLGSGLYLDDIYTEVAALKQQIDNNLHKNIYTILLILIFVILVVITLTLFANVHEGRLADRRLRGLAKNFMNLQIQERRRLSRELHDGINQLMVAVKFRIELGIKQINIGKDASGLLENISFGLAMINEAIKEVRRISHALRPGLLDKLGLEAALNNLLDQFHNRTNIEVKRSFSLRLNIALPDDLAITVYRIVQEALTNTERHAHATVFEIALQQTATQVKLILQDDGQGFSSEIRGENGDYGIGITNMRERVELLWGEFHIESTAGFGIYMRVTLPYNTQVI